jgi:hypothetical protein
VITYYFDPARAAIEGAVFEYFKVDRSHRGRWTAVPRPAGERTEAWVTQWGVTADGRPMPSAIEGRYVVGAETKRRVVFTVRDEQAVRGEVTPCAELELQPGRRLYEGWPPFQSAVYRARIENGQADYANRVGLVDALAFEGNLAEALQALQELLADFQSDPALLAESMGAIDWHLGYAVYEFLQRPDAPEYWAIWNDFAAVEPYISVLGRAVDFFGRWRRAEDVPRAEAHFQRFERDFGIKARLMHAIGRQLIDRVEQETHRGLELEAVLRETVHDDIRLRAVQGAVEAYLADSNYEAAWRAIDLAERLLTEPAHIETFNRLAAGWEQRIAEAMDDLVHREWEALVRAKQDLVGQLRGRLARADATGSTAEAARLRALREKTEAELAELTQ